MIVFLIGVSCLLNLTRSMPLVKTMIDMTYVYDETTPTYPKHKRFKIDRLINGSIDNLQWVQLEEFSTSSHAGTHMDAPAHFVKGGKTVELIPVSEFIAPAAVIDITTRAETDPNAEVTSNDLLEWEEGTGQSLDETVILINSGWGKKWTDRKAYSGEDEDGRLNFPGIAPEASQWLVDNRRIIGIGIDTLSIDRGSTTDFMSHVITLSNGLYLLENVANIDQLPAYGAKLYIFPMKIGKGSGAPTRVLASIRKIITSLPSVNMLQI